MRIVTLGGGLHEAPTVTVTPLWTHGFSEGDYRFLYAFSGALLRDGSAVVADLGNEEVIAVSERGFDLVMGSGRGPDEVRRPIAVTTAGARSVWLDDDGNGRLVLLSSDSVVRSISTQGRYDLTGALRVRGTDAEGRLLMSTSSFPREFEGRWRMADLVTLNPASLEADTVAQYRVAEAPSRSGRDPFQPYGTASVAGDRWVVGWGAEPELRFLDGSGAVEGVLRWVPETSYPGDQEGERYEANLRSDLRRVNPGISDAELRRLIARSIAELVGDAGKPLPFFREAIGDDQGNVWLEDYEVGTLPTASYTVIRPGDGRIRRVVFPSPVALLDIRDGLVLAVVRDSLDVQAVTVFRVELEES